MIMVNIIDIIKVYSNKLYRCFNTEHRNASESSSSPANQYGVYRFIKYGKSWAILKYGSTYALV